MSSQTPEKIVANYDSKSKQSKNVALEMKKIVERYRGKRITKENVCVLVSTLMLQAQNLKTVSGPDKKELVMDLIFSIIEQIDEGDTDSDKVWLECGQRVGQAIGLQA